MLIWELTVIPFHNLIIADAHTIELIPTSDPILVDIVWTAK